MSDERKDIALTEIYPFLDKGIFLCPNRNIKNKDTVPFTDQLMLRNAPKVIIDSNIRKILLCTEIINEVPKD